MLQRKKSVAAGMFAASAVGSSVVVAALLLLGGCGQKGPLMLPKPADAAASAASIPR